MDEEIMKQIEQNKVNNEGIDLISLIKGTKPGQENKNVVSREIKLHQNKNEKFIVSSTKKYIGKIQSPRKILIQKEKEEFVIPVYQDILTFQLFEKDSIILLSIIFNDYSLAIYEIYFENKSFIEIAAIDKFVYQVEKYEDDFYALIKNNNQYQIVKFNIGIPIIEVVIDNIILQRTSGFYFFNNELYFIKDNLLFNRNKIQTRIACQGMFVMKDFAVILDVKKQKSIFYLFDKNLVPLHEIIFEEVPIQVKTIDDFIAFQFENQIRIYQIIDFKFKFIQIISYENVILNFCMNNNLELILYVYTSKDKINKNELKEKKSNENDSKEIKEIIFKLIKEFDEERKEREIKEKKRMEMLLEKISEQLNKNLKLILESIIKKEMKPIIDKFESDLINSFERKIQSKIDSSFKNQENNFTSVAKKIMIQNIVPVVEAGFDEMRLQMMEYIKSERIIPEVEDKLKSMTIEENKQVQLFNLIQRNEILKGTELVLDSNDEVFGIYLKEFKPEFIEYLEPNTIVELIRRALMIKNSDDQKLINNFIHILINFVINSVNWLPEFLSMFIDEVFILMNNSDLVDLYQKILNLQNLKSEHFKFLEEILKNMEIHLLNDNQTSHMEDLINSTIVIKDELGYKDSCLSNYLTIQRNYLKKKKQRMSS